MKIQYLGQSKCVHVKNISEMSQVLLFAVLMLGVHSTSIEMGLLRRGHFDAGDVMSCHVINRSHAGK